MATPIPDSITHIARLSLIHGHVSGTVDSETKVALLDIVQERMAQVTAGYDAEHDAEHGVGHLVDQAAIRLDPTLGAVSSRRLRIEAAALLLASLEVEAYIDPEPGEDES